MFKMQLHWQIITGLLLGLVFGIISAIFGWSQFTTDWIAPFGTIFIRLLKFIAIPLVLTSLITGIASLSDLKKLSRIGGKTISIYIVTTAISVSIGLITVNLLQPGKQVPYEMQSKLQETYESDASSRADTAQEVKERGPLQLFIDMVPSNFFEAASNNRNMLQIVFISMLIGIGLVQIPKKKSKPVLDIFEGLNDVIIKLVDIIMLIAPLGVFSLIAQTINKVAGDDPDQVAELLGALGFYMIAVVVGLIIHLLVTYITILKVYVKMPLKTFFTGIGPAQLLAFSTSSSGATLPVTMERCEDELGVIEEVSSFVITL